MRRTYACPCCEQHVATTTKPRHCIKKGLASPRLRAMVATQKNVDGRPLYLLGEICKRMGLELDRTSRRKFLLKNNTTHCPSWL